MPTKTFCPLPWIHLAIRNNGDLRVCCQANAAKDRGILRDTNGEAFNARRSNLNEARNSQILKDLRKSMLEGEHHPVCTRCRKEEESGIRSRREYETYNWKDRIDYQKLIEATDQDGTIDLSRVSSTYYDIRFGNRCNLRCRMCGPTDSDSWYRDQTKVWGPKFYDTHGEVRLTQNEKGQIRPVIDDYSWVDDDQFWEQLRSNIQNIQHIYAVGGEPLLIEKHYDLLQSCVEEDVAKNIVLEYNSNISTLPPRALNLWAEFKEVRVGASIDGYGPVDEYIRYPSKWEKIETNLRTLNAAPRNINSWIAMTIQAYNILHLPEMIDWKLRSSLNRVNEQKRTPILTTHPLHNPSFLHVQILPPAYKELVSKRFANYLMEIKDFDFTNHTFPREHYIRVIKKTLGGYERLMLGKDRSEELPKFWNYTKKLDRIRNQSVDSVLPELAEHVEAFLAAQQISPLYDNTKIDQQIAESTHRLSAE